MPQRSGDKYPDKRAVDFSVNQTMEQYTWTNFWGVREDSARSQHFLVFSILDTQLPGTFYSCDSSGTTVNIAAKTQEMQHYKLLHPSSFIVPTAHSKGKRKNILHGVSVLLKQAQRSTDCREVQAFSSPAVTCSVNATILTQCSHSGEKQYWFLLLFCCFLVHTI